VTGCFPIDTKIEKSRTRVIRFGGLDMIAKLIWQLITINDTNPFVKTMSSVVGVWR